MVEKMKASRLTEKLLIVLVALVTAAVCVLPMDALPIWNGEIPGHRNQYELMAENILQGRLHFAYGDEDELLTLNNPYDPAERQEAGVYYHWDHAYYDGHYYMYFGVVPVFLLFLPYRVITGTALTTFHATQVFTAFFVAGIFVLFYLLRKRFFEKLPLWMYLALSAALSVMSVWYATAEPALYCTAITAAMALEIWSIYFFVRGVWVERKENRQLLFAGIGALLGALAFGCRPPIALANLLVIPMLWAFLKQRKFSLKLLGKLALAALPYVLVAAGLMLYNYARFDNPFEFGQKYQLTVADQSNYSITLNAQTILRVINDTFENFFETGSIQTVFPYVQPSSVFYNFPVLWLGLGMFLFPVLRTLKRTGLLPLVVGFWVTVLVITAMDILWTPYLLERYRMDIYFLTGIATFITLGLWHNNLGGKRQLCLQIVVGALSAQTLLCSFLYCVQTIGVYYPEKVTAIAQLLGLS